MDRLTALDTLFYGLTAIFTGLLVYFTNKQLGAIKIQIKNAEASAAIDRSEKNRTERRRILLQMCGSTKMLDRALTYYKNGVILRELEEDIRAVKEEHLIANRSSVDDAVQVGIETAEKFTGMAADWNQYVNKNNLHFNGDGKTAQNP